MPKFASPLLLCSKGPPPLYNVRQPFVAVCRKCGRTIFFDIDPSGTPGFNGDWGDGDGDYGCVVDSGENSEVGNSHVPVSIRYDRNLYKKPKDSTDALNRVRATISYHMGPEPPKPGKSRQK